MSDLYPLVTYSFVVTWGGTQIGFSEVSGLDVEVDVLEYRHGASPEYTKTKLAGMTKYSNLTLKRGTFASDNEYFDWWTLVRDNLIERRDITITLLDETRVPVVVWKVRNAWPLKVQSTGLKADGSEVAIETMELAHEGLTIQND
ncbi:MAG: phage tail protein [Crocinitomicaceae bacterium]|nr:phage tail protein [Crocinitomicaceae bacterium]